VRVLADGQTDTQTDANRFYNLSHATCYSYGTDKKHLNSWAEPNLKSYFKSHTHVRIFSAN